MGPPNAGLAYTTHCCWKSESTKAAKRFGFASSADRSRKDELSLLERLAQSVYEFGTKDVTEHLHGQEEGVFRANPASMVRGESPGRNHAVDVRMKASALTIP